MSLILSFVLAGVDSLDAGGALLDAGGGADVADCDGCELLDDGSDVRGGPGPPAEGSGRRSPDELPGRGLRITLLLPLLLPLLPVPDRLLRACEVAALEGGKGGDENELFALDVGVERCGDWDLDGF